MERGVRPVERGPVLRGVRVSRDVPHGEHPAVALHPQRPLRDDLVRAAIPGERPRLRRLHALPHRPAHDIVVLRPRLEVALGVRQRRREDDARVRW